MPQGRWSADANFYEERDPRDLFTSAGRRVHHYELEGALSPRNTYRFPDEANLARRALAGDQQAVDQFEAFRRQRTELIDGIAVVFLGFAGLVFGGRALTRRVETWKKERHFPRARALSS